MHCMCIAFAANSSAKRHVPAGMGIVYLAMLYTCLAGSTLTAHVLLLLQCQQCGLRVGLPQHAHMAACCLLACSTHHSHLPTLEVLAARAAGIRWQGRWEIGSVRNTACGPQADAAASAAVTWYKAATPPRLRCLLQGQRARQQQVRCDNMSDIGNVRQPYPQPPFTAVA
jgi:hypothetical protein